MYLFFYSSNLKRKVYLLSYICMIKEIEVHTLVTLTFNQFLYPHFEATSEYAYVLVV